MSGRVEVYPSTGMNDSDTVEIGGHVRIFSYDDENDTGSDLIVLYMYHLPTFEGYGIKIGMTTCKVGQTFRKSVESRIKKQRSELGFDSDPDRYERHGLKREILYWGICLDAHSDSFKDYYVHDRIKVKKAGLQEKRLEWFTGVPLDELIAVFEECRSEGEKKELYVPRKEQRECIEALKAYFSDKPDGGRFLMYCKMRFGKSFTAYKYCEEAGLNKILILTYVPAVQSSWRDDLGHISEDYLYFTDDNLRRPAFQPSEVSEPFVMFLSLQNYLGKEVDTKDVKARIKKIQSVEWDMLILDEYHFGAWNDNTRKTISSGTDLRDEFSLDYLKDSNQVNKVLKDIETRTHRTLCLSGTPFRALDSHEFGDAVFSYTYFDEQKNKYPNYNADDFRTVDPAYASFPDMRICGYDMGSIFGKMEGMYVYNKNAKRYIFSLNEFFKTDGRAFMNKDAVEYWLNVIKGAAPQVEGTFPYDIRDDLCKDCQHALWLMPSVESVGAMARMLRQDRFFSRYEIIDMSEATAGVGSAAYNYLMAGMNKADNEHKEGTITITVNKLTLGVTVKPWSAVFVLKDLASPESYFQSIFRVQTPYHADGHVKENGYVYDFNVDRAALLLMDFAKQSEMMPGNKSVTKARTARMIVKFLPIYLNGDMEHPIDEDVFYSLAELGDPHHTPLSKKISDTSRTTRIWDGETLAMMMNDSDVKEVFERVFAHAKFKRSKGSDPRNPPIDSPSDDFDPEITAESRDIGYRAGRQDHDMLAAIMDDAVFEQKFLERQKIQAEEKCPDKFRTKKIYPIYYNAFVGGYAAGVNVPIKNLNCGRDDGKKFVETVKEKLGPDIKWTRETSAAIRDLINNHLNDESNIPKEYRSALYKIWYHKSFTAAVKNALRPAKDVPSKTTRDAENIIQHILSRLFEFLYISVYRETTFQEIFNNADPDLFLEAVGITKDDFIILNRYHIFEENTLDSCIHDFFVNESLGSRLDMKDEGNRKRYRNSFNWFGYGVEDK